MYNELSEQEMQNLQIEASHIAQALESSDSVTTEYIESFPSPNRITVIANDGTVLFDNYEDVSFMENHSERPEVISALKTGSGSDMRLSETLGQMTYYHALRLTDGDVLRVAFTNSSIYSIILSSMPIFIAISILFMLITLIISSFLSYIIVKPIDPKNPNIYDELLPFVKKIETQQAHIDSQKYALEQRIIEFDAISKNIADGLVLLDANGNILSINKKAVCILGNPTLDYVSKPFIDLSRIIKIQEYIKRAYDGEFVDKIIQIQNKFFSFRISPVINNDVILGVVILLIDNTAQMETEQIRREFSANVSHELKTPLTSISGYAELIKTGLVQPQDVVPFAENIWNETAHLIELIEDIIKVSKLDESQDGFEFVPVELKSMLESTITRLEQNAQHANVSIKANLFPIEINAIKNVLNEIFYNVIENSIKYNKDGGTVCINMALQGENVLINIIDTGIGIPSSAQDRIFERFYRADTSHSSEITGSGLGLAIVKNGINLHGGTIDVSSTENIGTTVSISLKTH